MRVLKFLMVGIFMAAAIALGFWLGRDVFPSDSASVVSDTIYISRSDTIRELVEVEKIVVMEVEERVERAKREEESGESEEERGDSVWVVLPIEQKRYEDSLYTIWASGYRVSIDSAIFRHQDVVVRERKDSKWSFGIVAGIGSGRDMRIEPMIGVGVCYKIDLFKRKDQR